MSETWTMPEWLRNALRVCKYPQADIDRADQHYAETNHYLILGEDADDVLVAMSDTIMDLWELRAAGLLLTPGEKQIIDIDRDMLKAAEDRIYELRAENERLRGLVREAADTMQNDAGWDNVANLFRTALGADHD